VRPPGAAAANGMAADDPPVEFELEMEDAPGPPTPDEVLMFNAPAKGTCARDARQAHQSRLTLSTICI